MKPETRDLIDLLLAFAGAVVITLVAARWFL